MTGCGARRILSGARNALLGLAVLAAGGILDASSSAGADCGDLSTSVSCGVGADPSGGYFHGVIGVTGQGWVLDLAARSGSRPGCGDCVWTVSLDCPQSSAPQGDVPPGCTGMQAGEQCPPGTLPYRLYLTTSTVTNEVVGTVCLGGDYQIVAVGEDAEVDVDRHFRDVTPPDLVIRRRPHGATLAGLQTYFRAAVPAGSVGPYGFGNGTISESITLVPEQVDWEWGDGTASGWLPVSVTTEHRYLRSGALTAALTTRWGATYTATYEGRTVGPYDASGMLDRRQPFLAMVDISDPTLVSHARPGP